ncbi:MAG: 4-hydroxy-3-methylbut-2-enyl diphosphate reductase [Christensenellaceae bacterium]|jgi:4-hydroxy-3-methylbut-2-enyl diphosphate reductase|nr:4-hydroxy-3-methylbut-2-enyl diphosphate reductase [Christensenellaceae bacterium]
MQLLVADEKGFCTGIKRAVKMANEALAKHKTVYSYGALLHNKGAMSVLEKSGLIKVDAIESIPDNSVVILRSHGATILDIELLKEKQCKIIDATCPSVKAIHEKVQSFSTSDNLVIILGKPNHPEVKGIASRCKSYIVVDNIEEFSLPVDHKSILVVAQTTLDCKVYDDMVKKIGKLSKNNLILVEFYQSICYTNMARQNNAKNIALSADLMLIVGDKQSSNTKSLFDIASRFCKETYMISEVNDLGLIEINNGINKLGISAGASTPEELMMEVINIMEQENNVNNIKVSEDQNVELSTTETVVSLDESKPEAVNAAAPINSDVVQELNDSTASSEIAVDTTQEVTSVASETETLDGAKEPEVKASEPDGDPEKPKVQSEFERYMKTDAYNRVRNVREGLRLKACVESADASGVTVSLMEGFSGKNDSGFIDKSEMELDGSYNPSEYTPGTILEVLVIAKTDPKLKGANLSKKAVDAIKIEDEAVKKILEGEEFSFACTQVIKGGLLGKLGSYTIFVPGSQIRSGYVNKLDDYIGKKLRLKVMPPREDEENLEEGSEAAIKRKKNIAAKRIIASQRIILDEEREAKEDAFWEIMQPNHIIEGKVKKFTSFGAFVSIMGHDCLVHISDLAWGKVKDASDVLTLNNTYEFLVLKADREERKVSLGYKQLQKTPMQLAQENLKVGDIVKGKVERIKEFGVFVNLMPGLDGLIHISEIGRKWIEHPAEIFKPGDEVESKILAIEANKVTLSIRALMDQDEDQPVSNDTDEKTAKDDRRASSGLSRFNNRFDRSDNTKEKQDKRHNKNREDNYKADEHMEHTAAARTATFGDLFKNFDMKQFEKKD